MKILGTIATINADDCLDPADIDVIRTVVGIDATNSVLILPCEEDGFYISNGKLYKVSSCRGDFEVYNLTLQQFYKQQLEIFEEMCNEGNIDTSKDDFMGDVIENRDAIGWGFGCSDFPMSWKVDKMYQRIRALTFTEPALIIGSTMSDEECGCENYVAEGYNGPAADYFDIGITESGKWFAVQQGTILYFDTLEFQKFLEEEINSKGV